MQRHAFFACLAPDLLDSLQYDLFVRTEGMSSLVEVLALGEGAELKTVPGLDIQLEVHEAGSQAVRSASIAFVALVYGRRGCQV